MSININDLTWNLNEIQDSEYAVLTSSEDKDIEVFIKFERGYDEYDDLYTGRPMALGTADDFELLETYQDGEIIQAEPLNDKGYYSILNALCHELNKEVFYSSKRWVC